MTRQEIDNIKFRRGIHLSMEQEHTQTYTAIYGGHAFGICVHQPYSNGSPKGKSYSHYKVDEKVFNTKEEFYNHCESL